MRAPSAGSTADEFAEPVAASGVQPAAASIAMPNIAAPSMRAPSLTARCGGFVSHLSIGRILTNAAPGYSAPAKRRAFAAAPALGRARPFFLAFRRIARLDFRDEHLIGGHARAGPLAMRKPLTLERLRRYAIARSLFEPTTLSRAIDKLGFVQADPIRAPARAQD